MYNECILDPSIFSLHAKLALAMPVSKSSRRRKKIRKAPL